MSFITYAGLLHDTVPEIGDEVEVYDNGENVIVTVERLDEDGVIVCRTPGGRKVVYADLEGLTDAAGDA